MIIRIVKLTFRPEEVPRFIKLFEEVKDTIHSSNGCLNVELLKGINTKNVFFTYSHWIDTDSLELYRNSEFFRETWIKTKALFAEKAEAWSLEKFVNLPDTESA